LASTKLTLSGTLGNALTIASGSTLYLDNATNDLTIEIGDSSTTAITGNVVLDNAAHRLISNTAGRITVGSGGSVATASTYPATAYAFGNGTGGNGVAALSSFRAAVRISTATA